MLLACPPPPSPPVQAAVTRHAVREGRWTLEGVELSVDGQDVRRALDAFDVVLVHRSEVEFADRLEAPELLRRTFARLELETRVEAWVPGLGGVRTQVAEATSPLEGRTVRFERETDGWRAVAEGDALELPARLEATFDLAAFLPPDPDRETWSVPPTAVEGLFHPGGDLGWRPPPGAPPPLRLEGFAGEVRARRRRTFERDGEPLAEVALEFEVTATPRTPELESLARPRLPEAVAFETTATEAQWSFEGRGSLLWAPRARQVRSLQLEGRSTARVQRSGFWASGSVRQEVVQSLVLSGPDSIRVDFGD